MPSTARHTKAETLLAALLDWYDAARRDLPWRAPAGTRPDPYAVLVSEVMLQQTTATTVAQRYPAFVERFPALEALAAAPLDDVLHAWQGLGYYRRARALHAAARAVAAAGVWPRSPAEWAALPGVGPYTAAAIAAIAFDAPVLAVDGNVERVLARLYGIATPLPAARAALRRLALDLAPRERPGDAVQAMMELGALVCRPRAPACPACPLRTHCVAHRSGTAATLPRRMPKRPRAERFAVAFHLVRPDGAVAFRKRPPTGLLAGLMELPSTAWTDRPLAPNAVASAAPGAAAWHTVPGRVRHVFTHLQLSVEVRSGLADGPTAPDLVWCAPASFAALALPTLTRKLLAHAVR